jgi:hypothetical protein
MPILDLSDEELQGLIMICANGSGPGVTWLLTNAILTKAQQAAQKDPPLTMSRRHGKAPQPPQAPDGLDLNPPQEH